MQISKKARKKIKNPKPNPKYEPKKIQVFNHPDIKIIGKHQFKSGNEVNIFDVNDYRALNQLIGYAKFINTDYGDVFYRGETSLHDTLLPSIERKPSMVKYEDELSKVINNANNDEKFIKFAKLSDFRKKKTSTMVTEAILQHYGYATHFIDVVDNHWVALWFGLNKYRTIKNRYSIYERRLINPIDLIHSETVPDIYQYMILVAVDNNAAPLDKGVYFGNDVITIDLRSSLPSVFLRPHAQHGLVIKKNLHVCQDTYDLSKNVIAIARMRIDKVSNWIGQGSLLSNENLFPSPAYDYGYEILLQREDIFKNPLHNISIFA